MSTIATFEQLRSEHSGDFLRLRTLWEKHSHLGWAFAAVNSSVYRDALIASLDSIHPSERLELNTATQAHQLEPALLKANARSTKRLHIICAEGHLPDRAWWQYINTLRERLAKAFPHLIVWWLPDSCITELARNAVDFWNWRTMVCRFELKTPVPLSPLEVVKFDEISFMEKQSLQARLEEIEAYLKTSTTPDSLASTSLRLEAARAHARLGDWSKSQEYAEQAHCSYQKLGDELNASRARGQIARILDARGLRDEALQIYQEILTVFAKLGDARFMALIQGRIANILQAKGQWKEALRLLQETLPVFEQLGDVRAVAVSQAQIADILLSKGQLDEALRIHREEVLPVFEKLGDVYSIAATQSRLADILLSKGHLDEALRIRREEVLPVFKTLGDVRSITVTQARIADTLLAQGQLDEALRLLQETLPVFEKLGDVMTVAISQARIAEILLSKGQLDEALRIHREEVLPETFAKTS